MLYKTNALGKGSSQATVHAGSLGNAMEILCAVMGITTSWALPSRWRNGSDVTSGGTWELHYGLKEFYQPCTWVQATTD